jgi:hypothetical protein
MVNAGAHAHRKQADQADKVAAEHEQAVASRESRRESDIWMDASNAHNREILVAKVERERARIAAGRELRAEIVADMSPEEVRALDRSREDVVLAQARERQMEEHLKASTAHERYRGIDRGGPGFER